MQTPTSWPATCNRCPPALATTTSPSATPARCPASTLRPPSSRRPDNPGLGPWPGAPVAGTGAVLEIEVGKESSARFFRVVALPWQPAEKVAADVSLHAAVRRHSP